MITLAEILKGNFVIANLGAAGDGDCAIPKQLRKSVTLVEVDATNGSQSDQSYYKRVPIHSVIAGTRSIRQFRINKNQQTSSLLEPRNDLISSYGLEFDFTQERLEKVECNTLLDVMSKNQLRKIDFLKTDLEGLDFEVLKSAKEMLDSVIAIQCELRFQPFYHGEPYFHEVVSYLNEVGFEVIGLEPEYWKPATQHRRWHTDGRITFCDVILFKKPEFI